MKKNKKNGVIIEEFICYGLHTFIDGVYKYTMNDIDGGEYTGRFKWESDNYSSPWYTYKTAPRWLKKLCKQIFDD